MSMKSANAFLERMKTDQELARKVGAIKTPEEFQSFVASQGYDFTFAEWREAAALSEDDLEHVSGGTDGPFDCHFSKYPIFLTDRR